MATTVKYILLINIVDISMNKTAAAPAKKEPEVKAQAKAEAKTPEAAKPVISGQDPFTSLGKHSYSAFEDDFVTKPFVLKFSTSNQDKTGVAVKSTLKAEKAEGKTTFKLEDEIKAWYKPAFLPNGSWVWARLRGKDIKLQFQLPPEENYNLGFGLSSCRALQKWDLRMLANFTFNPAKGLRIEDGFRLKYSPSNLVLYHRSAISYNSFKLNFAGAYDIFNNCLLKKDLLLGFKHSDVEAFVRHEDDWAKSKDGKGFSLGNLIANVMFKHSDSKVGLEYATTAKFDTHKITGLLETSHSSLKGATAKLKLGSDLQGALSLKHKVNKVLTVTGTVSSNLKDVSQSSLGMQWDISA